MKIVDVYETDLNICCKHCGTNIKHCIDVVDDNGVKKTIGKDCFENLYLLKARPDTKTRFKRLFSYGKFNGHIINQINKSFII